MLTQAQSDGVKVLERWYKKADRQVSILAGYAGTGKTYLTNYILEEFDLREDEVAMCTYTGNASLILSRKQEKDRLVSTIHRLIYDVDVQKDGTVEFTLKNELKGIKLIVVDEISMVDDDLMKDLLSFDIPILGVGDHGQLPPIGKETNVFDKPDVVLTEILRQAEDNPIIYLSKLVREGKSLPVGKMGEDVLVIGRRDKNVNEQLLNRADQVICGYNHTRKNLNKRMRENKGFYGSDPQLMDKVVLTKNDWGKQVEGYNYVNGMVGYITNEPEMVKHFKLGERVWDIEVQPDFLQGRFENLSVLPEDFKGEKRQVNRWQGKYVDRMDYGYAMTCHKAQGSQWDNVVVWNEPFGDEPWRWSYTAVTRAAKKLIVVL